MNTTRISSAFLVACGLFLLVGVAYLLTSPGRIDMIDGQARFEVSRSLVEAGQPNLRDPLLRWMGVKGRKGRLYSHYAIGASATGAPFIALAKLDSDFKGEFERFMFSLTTPFFGALLAGIFFLFLIDLGVAPRAAIGWTLVNAFATLVFPGMVTTFDNGQQAVFVLCAVWFAWRSAQRKSMAYAIAGGLCGGWLINFVEHFAIILPCLALATVGFSIRFRLDGEYFQTTLDTLKEKLASDEGRASVKRYVAFGFASATGLLVMFAFNAWRFGSPFNTGKFNIPDHPPFFGNPLYGLPGLLVSPGKGILFFSPPILLALFGYAGLRRRAPMLATTIAATTLVLVPFLACIRFFGGDWCWGPRYLIPILPLWALTFAFLPKTRFIKVFAPTIIVIGFGVQLLGISLDHQRFFLDNCLRPHFWSYDQTFYFRESQLFARPGELLDPVNKDAAEKACWFRPGPYEFQNTYTLFGLDPEKADESPLWRLNFEVFHVGRPWPCWIPRQPVDRRPINVEHWLYGSALAALAGFGLVYAGLRQRKTQWNEEFHSSPPMTMTLSSSSESA